jgi:hypothetical protein
MLWVFRQFMASLCIQPWRGTHIRVHKPRLQIALRLLQYLRWLGRSTVGSLIMLMWQTRWKIDFSLTLTHDDVFLRGGTLPSASRASDRPMAMACFGLVTFLPETPLFRVPCLKACIVSPTLQVVVALVLAMKFSNYRQT